MTALQEPPYVARCDVRVGVARASWPVGRFELTPEHLRVRAFPFADVTLAKSDVTVVRRASKPRPGSIEIVAPSFGCARVFVGVDWESVVPMLRCHGYRVDERAPYTRAPRLRLPLNPDDVGLDR